MIKALPIFYLVSRNTRRYLAAILILIGFTVAAILAPISEIEAADPTNGTLNPNSTTPITWVGTATGGGALNDAGLGVIDSEGLCVEGTTCDSYTLTVGGNPSDWTNKLVHIEINWSLPASDYDLYVHKGTVDGPIVASSGRGATSPTGPLTKEDDTFDPTDPAVGTGAFVVRVVYYLATSADQYSGLIKVVPAPPEPAPAAQGSGPVPRFQNFTPSRQQMEAGFGMDAAEPSIGVSWLSGNVFFQSGLQTLRVKFDDSCPSSPRVIWEDKTSAQTGAISFDPILYTDSQTGRTIVSQLLFGTTTSAMAVSPDEGETWLPSMGAGIASGIDHQTVGGGPFHAPLPSGAIYNNAVYYCAQDLVMAGCALSLDGGITYGAAVPAYALTDCGGLHGHVKVGPDGTVYLPNKGCGDEQAVIVSENNGVTWETRKIPNTRVSDSDPSVATGRDGRLYVGLANGDKSAVVAVSDDKGLTWKSLTDVGASQNVRNLAFPAMVSGDNDRAAMIYLGTTETGDLQSRDFKGTWYAFISTTYDGGLTWQTVNATPNDPVQRGAIWLQGGGEITRNLLDFNDATVDAEGRILFGYADGCIGACVQGRAQAVGNSYSAVSSITRQTGGRRMFSRFDPPEFSAPGAPYITVTRNGARAHLTWSQSDTGGSPITNFKIYRRLNGGSFAQIADAGTATSYDDLTIEPGVDYFYKIVAVNAAGSSCGSNEVFAKPVGSSCSAIRVVNDAAGDQVGAPLTNAGLDVQYVSVAEPYFTDGSQTLAFTMKVGSLATIPRNSEWRVVWNYPTAPGGNYWVGMTSDANGTAVYEYGVIDVTSAVITSVGVYTKLGNADAGRMSPDGTITIEVANNKVGNPQAGDLIGALNGRTYMLTGLVASSTRAAIDTTSEGATYLLYGNGYCAPATITTIEDNDPTLNFSPGWHNASAAGASAGHFGLTGKAGTVSYNFAVSPNKFGAISYNYASSSKGGSAEIFIDGISKGVVSYLGNSTSGMTPTFGSSQRYSGLQAGPHTIEVRGMSGTMYVDAFILESSFSNSQPAQIGPGQTSSTTNTMSVGQELIQPLQISPGTESISILAESNGLPLKLILLSPTGSIIQSSTSNIGLVSIDAPVQSGTYVLKTLNLNLGPLQVRTLTTPYGSR